MSEHAPGPGAVPGAPGADRGPDRRGFGLREAHQVVAAGAEVVLGGRTAQRLAAAARELGPAAPWRTVDITDRASPAAFFAPLERVTTCSPPPPPTGWTRCRP
ncbi:hypothetical protein [Streptomyces achromogenes]|uniref:hypothetical protein n=1 Tax=Streptomyces achromogenes TaxID=67255 RepID=UPI00342FD9E3